MANELTVFQAISSAGQAITSMTHSIRTLKTIRRQDSVAFREHIRYIKHVCRAKGYGELTRLSLDEMEKTFQRIEQNELSPELKAMSLELLNTQFLALKQNIQRYVSD